MLQELEALKKNKAWKAFMNEMRQKFNNLYLEAMNPKLSDSARVHKLEQQRGIGLAIDWYDSVVSWAEKELELIKEETNG